MGIPLPPPWVLLSLILAGSRHINDAKEIAGLSWAILRGKKEGGCQLCDKLVTVVLKQVELDDLNEGGGIDCDGMCFKVGKCIKTCQKITAAMSNSSGFPCIAAGLCPAEDEFGEVSCKWSYRSMGCEPASACVYKFPKCELNDGYKKWKQVNRLLSDNMGHFDNALRHRKKCSEKDAGPFCIRESEGLGFLAEWGGLVLIFLGGAACSVHAIETPGGDDDRQWLTFWIIMMVFFIVERFADVLLSQLPRYYEAKFAALIWLMFYQGADKIYRLVRATLKKLSRALPWLFPRKRELTEAQYILTLPRRMQGSARREGLSALLSSFRCDHDIERRFGASTVMKLWNMWNNVDPRYVSVFLLSAANLPAMDDGGTTDAYVRRGEARTPPRRLVRAADGLAAPCASTWPPSRSERLHPACLRLSPPSRPSATSCHRRPRRRSTRT